MDALIAKIRLFIHEARTKVTTYVGLLIASAAEIRDNWPEVVGALPHWHWLTWAERHLFVFLGLLVVLARVRRALSAV